MSGPDLKFVRVVQGRGVRDWLEGEVGAIFLEGEAIGLLEPEGPKLIAGVVYCDYTGPSVSTHIAIRGRLTREFLWAIFDYPFNGMGCRRITAGVDSASENVITLVERLGFDLEARLHGAAHSGLDTLVYRMWKGHCRWISPEFTARFGRVRHG